MPRIEGNESPYARKASRTKNGSSVYFESALHERFDAQVHLSFEVALQPGTPFVATRPSAVIAAIDGSYFTRTFPFESNFGRYQSGWPSWSTSSPGSVSYD